MLSVSCPVFSVSAIQCLAGYGELVFKMVRWVRFIEAQDPLYFCNRAERFLPMDRVRASRPHTETAHSWGGCERDARG